MAQSRLLSQHNHNHNQNQKQNQNRSAMAQSGKGVVAARRGSEIEELSEDLIDYILRMVIRVRDYIRLGGVCKAWRMAVLKQNRHPIINSSYHHQPPLLILPYDNSGDLHPNFYNFSHNKVYKTDSIAIPIRYRNRQFHSGSSFGWLAFAESDFSITLINPFTTNAAPILLPPVMLSSSDYDNYDITYPECFIYKVFFSCDPCAHPLTYVVAVIFGDACHAAFIRPGQKSWTGIDKSFEDVCDIVFSGFKLFALNLARQLIVIDYYSDSLVASVAEEKDILTADIALMHSLVDGAYDLKKYSRACYIVDMGDGRLLHVVRFYLLDHHGGLDARLLTTAFKLYELKNRDWVEIHSIGDFILFLGGNASICTSSTPPFTPNCIYFVDDLLCRCASDMHTTDMGIFDIDTKIIDKLCILPAVYPTSYGPSAIWISPTL